MRGSFIMTGGVHMALNTSMFNNAAQSASANAAQSVYQAALAKYSNPSTPSTPSPTSYSAVSSSTPSPMSSSQASFGGGSSVGGSPYDNRAAGIPNAYSAAGGSSTPAPMPALTTTFDYSKYSPSGGGSAVTPPAATPPSNLPQDATLGSDGAWHFKMPSGGIQLPGGVNVPGAITPPAFNPYGVPADQMAAIQAQAAAKSAADIAARTTVANQQKAGYQQSYDRMNQQTEDTRNLENFKNSQLLSPFNGFSDYAEGQIARTRGQQDLQNQQDLQTKLGNVDSQLADYANASEADKQKMVNDMAQQLSDYKLKEQAQQNQNDLTKNTIGNTQFNQGISQAGVTGYYNPYSSQIQQMQANSAAWFKATPAEKQQLAAQNQQIGASIGATQNANGDWVYPQAQRTLAGKASDLNATQITAVLTGYLPNGQPTSAQQKTLLENEWKVADETGVITPTLSQIYGIPAGTPTQAAKNQAAQLAISRMSAATSAANSAASIANMNADNTRADNTVNLSQSQRDAEGTIAGDLAKAKTKDAVTAYFNANAAHFVPIVGQDTWEKMKANALAQYDKVTPNDKQDLTIREKAIAAAQNDTRWSTKDSSKNADLIKEYESYYQ
jgi:hypothetical protein